ncbi:MAG: DUF5110 domain-containing protein [Candidatus Eisenbacteria bacterium]|uniref:DUF5110 domain-containing protein n=1 Tax=Eiseniibacteriota bacterium TaxID=2212470 RepID=A0A849SJC5_UNCEI|nr:DUF5110 domain-containing protein [Candidatus Eisenbacteria bacterium]
MWPGACVFPDFTRAATRSWWSDRVASFMAQRLDGVWSDMNEPAVFKTPNKSMPESNRHEADPELGGPDSHARYHNVYGMLMARASFEGCLRARPESRPFVLSRANYLGGFGGTASAELYSRWIGVGALFPFARARSEKGSPRREPWSFGARVESTSRRALETRMRLLPYLDSCFEEASRTGVPVMRPLCLAAPRDPGLHGEDQSFLLGDDVLVEAGLDSTRARSGRPASERFASPRGPWRRANVHGAAEALADPDLPALHMRPGSIVPLGPIVQHVDERPLDEVEILISLDAEGRATGTLYEDDGDGFGYRDGDFLRTHYKARLEGGILRVRIAASEGRWSAPSTRSHRVTVIGDRVERIEDP